MSISAISKGLSAGIAVGSMVYALTDKKKRTMKRLKRKTSRAITAFTDIADSIADILQ